MPIISTRAAASASGFGFGGGRRVLAPSTAITLMASNPARGSTGTATYVALAGYAASITFYMVGDGSQGGYYYPYDCGHSSSGEFSQFKYVATGAETSYSITWNLDGTGTTNNRHRLQVVGGANNGASAFVGSSAASCAYGDAAPPTSRSGESSAAFTRQSYGAYAVGVGRYYSDDYYYSPCGYSYGTGVNGYSGYGAAGGCSAGGSGAMFIKYNNDY